MTFRQFAFNNVLRNKRLYAAYFLSSLFTVMVFFTFAIFAFHPSFQDSDMNKNAMFGLAVAGGIIYVFSFFFVLYSMSAFLQSRKKEFGLLMMQGMSTRQIRLMVFMENMLIGLFATISGILLGLVFAKLILLLAENVLILEENLYFYWPFLAMLITFISFIILFLFISFFVSFILRTHKLVDLIKGDKKPKDEPKASVLLSILAVLLLAGGYGTALYVKGMAVMMAMIPVVVVVVIGTYLLFSQLNVFMIRRLKRNKALFWRNTNMVLFSDLSFRMKDNARAFFMVAIISTVAFSAIGALYGTHSYLTKGIVQANPFTYSYHPYENTKNIEKNVQYAQNTIDQNGIEAERLDITRIYLPMNGKSNTILVLKAADYNKAAQLLGKPQLDLKEKEAVVAKKSIANLDQSNQDDNLLEQTITLMNGEKIKPIEMVEAEAYPNFENYYIVSDHIYNQLPKPVKTEQEVVWYASNKNTSEQLRKTGEVLQEHYEPRTFFSIDFIIYEIEKGYGPILFIGLFIGIVFFVSAGSFLYFRLFTDLSEDKIKFQAIAKMGLTVPEMKKIVNRQTALLFFAPMMVALIHGAVALTSLSRMFSYNLVTESAMVLTSFLVIQIIYYLIVRFFYIKQIKEAIQ
ncbi:ABC transporter permease [Pseudobacillus wudalianchiensis]|uniref:ABC transporter permease n=1 Tax=Pseudobacillus wudalianchiensis TaxID=1743143 RepID=A0A1B9AUB7_9BACI|nr:ABC transporter permease [Bacillus wudalianchiensis]OCA87452.1 ABC transporter permease [Bacillus wudalianchiensis]